MKSVFLLVCAVMTTLTNAAPRSCPWGWSHYNGRCFRYMPSPMAWAVAERNCRSQDGNLASVHSYAEFDFKGLISRATHGNPETWLGGSDAQYVSVPEAEPDHMTGEAAFEEAFPEAEHEEEMTEEALLQEGTDIKGDSWSPETWLGGSDAQHEGVWLWTDSSHFTFTHFCRGEPNNFFNQHCLQMNYGGGKCWDDVWCDKHRPSVCAKRI
ncbi:ladderlectin-like [Notolabrus celidotus]|uniref:ladderlectin-like n=1 Tax=Notolabrus celidotus TaxID=1203425 RepID=UPI00149023FF|nr:ladderlectin-like [Notolabrus celidotus]